MGPNSIELRWDQYSRAKEGLPLIQKKKGGHNYNRAKVGTITAELVGSNKTKKRSAKTEQWWSPYQRVNLGTESTQQR
jgi:hypothetical protein